MLRNVFWRAGAKLEVLDEEYARQVRIAQANGRAPGRAVRGGRCKG